MALKDVLELVGLGAPFTSLGRYIGSSTGSTATRRPQAKRAISAPLKSEPYWAVDVGREIIVAFDRLYTSPLLRWRAFLKSLTNYFNCPGSIHYG